jgi:hypothetical protein
MGDHTSDTAIGHAEIPPTEDEDDLGLDISDSCILGYD